MNIAVHVDESVLVAVPSGEMDANNCAEFGETVRASLRPDISRIEVDARALTFIDSSGISTLIELHELMGERSGSLSVVEPTTPVRRVLEITGLASAFGL